MYYLPEEYFSKTEFDLLDKHFHDCVEEIPRKMLKRFVNRCLSYEKLKKSRGEEILDERLRNLKNNKSKNRSYSMSSTSSNESSNSNFNSRLYDESISYSQIVVGKQI